MAVVEIVIPVRVACPARPTPEQLAQTRDAVTRAVGHGIDRAISSDEAGPGGTVDLRAPTVRLAPGLRGAVRPQVARAVTTGVREALRDRRAAIVERFGQVTAEPRVPTTLTLAEALRLLWTAYAQRHGGTTPWPPPGGEHPGLIGPITEAAGRTHLLVVTRPPSVGPDGGPVFARDGVTVLPFVSISPRGVTGAGRLPGGTVYRLERFGLPRTYPQIAEDVVTRGNARVEGARRRELVEAVTARLAELQFGTQPYAVTGLDQTVMFPEGALPDVVVAVAPADVRAESAPVEELVAGPGSAPAPGRHPLLDVSDAELQRLHESGARLAAVLGMAPPASDTDLPRFLRRAAARYDELARAAGDAGVAEGTASLQRVRPQCDGNNGVLDVTAAPSAALDELRRLGRALAPFTAMIAGCAKIAAWTPGELESEIGAMNSYLIDVPRALHESVARQLAEACRVILMQQLRASASTIAVRRSERGLAETVSFMRSAIRVLGPDLEQLLWLQRALREMRLAASAAVLSTLGGAAPVPATVGDVIGAVRDRWRAAWNLTPEMWQGLLRAPVRVRPDGHLAVVWRDQELTDADLTERITAQRRLMNLVDPMFVQIEAIEPLMIRARRDPEHLEDAIRALLAEMASASADLITEVAQPGEGAWRATATSHYVEESSRTSVLRYQLHGIHALARDAIDVGIEGEAARAAFDRGTNAALWRQHSRDLALQVAGGVGIVVLTIFCAPLGAAVAGAVAVGSGIALAAFDVMDAIAAERTFRALENPEEILLWHEVEVAQIMAVVSLGLTAVTDVLPVARGAISAARQELRAAAREGVERSVREATAVSLRATYRETAERMVAQVGTDLVAHAFVQLATTAVLERLLPVLLAPALGALEAAVAAEHGRVPGVPADAEEPGGAGGARPVAAGATPRGEEPPDGELVDEEWLDVLLLREEIARRAEP